MSFGRRSKQLFHLFVNALIRVAANTPRSCVSRSGHGVAAKWTILTSYWFENESPKSNCKALAEASNPFMPSTVDWMEEQARNTVIKTVADFLLWSMNYFRSEWKRPYFSHCFKSAHNSSYSFMRPNRRIAVERRYIVEATRCHQHDLEW